MQVDMVESGQCQTPVPEPKLYLLSRRDLPWPVRCVQAAHAAITYVHGQMQFAYDHGDRTPNLPAPWGRYGPAIVLLGVADEVALEDWHWKLPDSAAFREPDLGDQLTAVAYYGEPVSELEELKLM